MSPETLEALKASIAKWERNARVRSHENYLTAPKDCPLCGLFYFDADCIGCPIAQSTGLKMCAGTPYEDAAYAWRAWEWEWEWADIDAERSAAAVARAAALAEVAFLKSLLPSEEPRP